MTKRTTGAWLAAALTAAVKVGQRPENEGKTIVVIIPSFAERYLSTALFEGLGDEEPAKPADRPAGGAI